MLKTGGCFILTIPYSLDEKNREHYPGLIDYENIQLEDGRWAINYTTRDGKRLTDNSPIFHGGPGRTLELRAFSMSAILNHLKSAGFRRIQVQEESDWTYGVHMPERWSLPIVAQR